MQKQLLHQVAVTHEDDACDAFGTVPGICQVLSKGLHTPCSRLHDDESPAILEPSHVPFPLPEQSSPQSPQSHVRLPSQGSARRSPSGR